jgi:hypothetical protein
MFILIVSCGTLTQSMTVLFWTSAEQPQCLTSEILMSLHTTTKYLHTQGSPTKGYFRMLETFMVPVPPLLQIQSTWSSNAQTLIYWKLSTTFHKQLISLYMFLHTSQAPLNLHLHCICKAASPSSSLVYPLNQYTVWSAVMMLVHNSYQEKTDELQKLYTWY